MSKILHIFSNPRRVLPLVVIGGAALRIFYIGLFLDLRQDFYWEYGEIVKNMHAGKGYSLFHFENNDFTIRFDPTARVFPSAYMPPGYVMFLFPFFYVDDVPVRNVLILATQILVSCLGVLAVYNFCVKHVDPRSALLAASIISFLPEFVFASCSYSPTVFYHLGIVLLLLSLYEVRQQFEWRKSIIIGCLCTFLMYMRIEFTVFSIIMGAYLWKTKGSKTAAVVIGVIVLLFLPWQVRNWAVFGEWVPFTTSGGLNFFRGHNEIGIGAWADGFTQNHFAALPQDKSFELAHSKLFLDRGLDFFVDHPGTELRNSLLKILHLWFINPNDTRTANLIYVVPWILLLAFTFIGCLRKNMRQNHKIILLFLVYSTTVAVAFFALPRYQTMMKIVLVPFAAYGWGEFRKHVWGDSPKTF